MKNIELWHLGDNKRQANKLFKLVKEGKKTATSYLFEGTFEEAQYSFLTNWDKSEMILLETINTNLVKFKDVTPAHAYKEGEGNRTLKYWKKQHKKFFDKQLKKQGKKFDEDILIITEEFKIKEKK